MLKGGVVFFGAVDLGINVQVYDQIYVNGGILWSITMFHLNIRNRLTLI